MRLNQPFTYYYFIESNGAIVGSIRVVDPDMRRIGIAKALISNHDYDYNYAFNNDKLYTPEEWEDKRVLLEDTFVTKVVTDDSILC